MLTVASSIYAANLLHVKDMATTHSSTTAYDMRQQRRGELLARAVRVTLERVGELLLEAAGVDEVLRCNSGIVWMAAQLRGGAVCGADGLRQMGLAAIPPRPRHGLVAPARLAVAPAGVPRASGAGDAPLAHARARAIARDTLARHRRFAAA